MNKLFKIKFVDHFFLSLTTVFALFVAVEAKAFPTTIKAQEPSPWDHSKTIKGIEWSDSLPGYAKTTSQAKDMCAAIGGRLPSYEDFKAVGDEYSTLPKSDGFYRTSTVVNMPDCTNCTLLFSTYVQPHGGVPYVPEDWGQNVRCIRNPT
jgi:hypothetical protein